MTRTTIALLVLFLSHSGADAYEVETHEWLSWYAADRSVLGSSGLLTSWGLDSYASGTYLDVYGTPGSIRDLIGRGAIFEDGAERLDPFIANMNGYTLTRPFHHFYDPQYNNGAGRPLQILGINSGFKSFNWALENFGSESLTSDHSGPQNNSLNDAFVCFENGMIGASENFRRRQMGCFFQSLGHVIHHLQDMGQPQHTRNGTHTFSPANFYEKVTGQRFDTYQSLSDFLDSTWHIRFPLPNLTFIKSFGNYPQFWKSGSSTGMASFTSGNFVSAGSMFALGPDGTIRPDPTFPKPDGSSASVLSFNEFLSDFDPDTPGYSGTFDYVVRNVQDELYGFNFPNVKMGQVTAMVGAMIHFGHPGTVPQQGLYGLVENTSVFLDRHDILLPRAASFSEGLIDFALRARISLARDPDTNEWLIKNETASSKDPLLAAGSQLEGRFQLAYEDPIGERHLFSGGTTVANVRNLSTLRMTVAEPPENTTKIVAFFSGHTRSSTSVQPDRSAVAAHVIPYVQPPTEEVIECTQAASYLGNENGIYVANIQWGSTPGIVQTEFQAFHLPDAMTITANNSEGTVIATTGGPVTGYHFFEFFFDPEILGTTTVNIEVIGNGDPDNQWVGTNGCPGQLLNNSDRVVQMVPVEFSFGENDGFGFPAGSCNFSLYIDGQYRHHVNTGATGVRFSLELTAGRHSYEYVNKSCNGGAGGVNPGGFSSRYTDSSGTKPLRNAFFGGAGFFPLTVAEP